MGVAISSTARALLFGYFFCLLQMILVQAGPEPGLNLYTAFVLAFCTAMSCSGYYWLRCKDAYERVLREEAPAAFAETKVQAGPPVAQL